jgi:hydrogenase expression/formation protein HypD
VNHINTVYEVSDMAWRGMGIIPQGGLKLRESWCHFDATKKLAPGLPIVQAGSTSSYTLCRSGEVLSGTLKPFDCEHFGKGCSPEHPLGAPMVSSEGACAAYYRYSTLRS